MKRLVTVFLLSSILTPVYAADTPATPEVAGNQHSQVDEIQTINCPPSRKFLSDSVRSQLLALASHLKGKNNVRMEIAGHVDEQKLSAVTLAMYGDKVGLSKARAKQAADFLHAQPGLADVVIEISGKGDSEPKVRCGKKLSKEKYGECLAPNRRVEIHIRYEQAAEPVKQVAAEIVPAAVVENSAAPAPASTADVAPAVTGNTPTKTSPVSAIDAVPSSAKITSSEAAPSLAPATMTESVPAVTTTDEFKKGFYAAAGLGLLNYSNATSAYDGSALPNPASLQLNGGYRFSQRMGVEVGYSLIGGSILKSSGNLVLTERLKASILNVAAIGIYSIGSRFDVFGKLGLANTAFDYSYSSSASTPSTGFGSRSKVNLMVGLGAQYDFNRCYSVRAQYENFGKISMDETFNNGTSKNANIGLSVISIGGIYNF